MQDSSIITAPVIVWFRQDLRLQDNPALQAAIETGRPVLPVFILDDAGEADWPMGGASRWWLHHALEDLNAQLKELGGGLFIGRGSSDEVLRSLIDESGARSVYWNRRYEPHVIARDSGLKSKLQEDGREVRSFNSALLHEPHEIAKKDGTPFKVFTPYWKHCLKISKSDPVQVDLRELRFNDGINGLPISSLELLPKISWDSGFYDLWKPARGGAEALLDTLLQGKIDRYNRGRDQLPDDGTSMLSPYLHFGMIGPREIWAACEGRSGKDVYRYLAEIGWREFSYHLLFHFPSTPLEPLRPEFEEFPWEEDTRLLRIWQRGETGFPVVDAGMRQLWKTGWMHNRARMITASFLVKHLLQPWQSGARWFWDTLVDADLASNTQGWQWTAGCGADASPYFRVFNPILQGEKFDSDGAYVRRWVPELSGLPDSIIHKPWEADAFQLSEAGITLGKEYPHPVIEHAAGRSRALKAYELFKVSTKK